LPSLSCETQRVMTDLGGGGVAAFGFSYQYLQTAEVFLTVLRENPELIARATLVVEPLHKKADGKEDDVVDFAIEVDSDVVYSVQVKSSSEPDEHPLQPAPARDALERLVAYPASNTLLLTNKPISPGLLEELESSPAKARNQPRRTRGRRVRKGNPASRGLSRTSSSILDGQSRSATRSPNSSDSFAANGDYAKAWFRPGFLSRYCRTTYSRPLRANSRAELARSTCLKPWPCRIRGSPTLLADLIAASQSTAFRTTCRPSPGSTTSNKFKSILLQMTQPPRQPEWC
jgi:hypothetical protein